MGGSRRIRRRLKKPEFGLFAVVGALTDVDPGITIFL